MAITEADTSGRASSSSSEPKDGASTEMRDTESACNSFWELEGRAQGAIGVEGAFGITQQAGVEQCLKSQPLQQQLDSVTPAFGLRPVETEKTPCHARTNPSRRTTADFANRDVMASSRSF